MKRIFMDISDETHEVLKKVAFQNNCSMKSIIENFIQNMVKKEKSNDKQKSKTK